MNHDTNIKNDKELVPEIMQFFRLESGTSLILRGLPGSGKTTFALQVLESFLSEYKGIYLSTRVGDTLLHVQFPWLKSLERNIKVIDAGKLLLEVLAPKQYETEKTELVKRSEKFLKEVSGEKSKKTDRTMYDKYLKDRNILELERVYDEVEKNLPGRTLLVVDSVEGITTKYGIDADEFVYALVKDLVENSNAIIVFVLEKEALNSIEYIVDGVVVLDRKNMEGKRIREIKFEKLRGIPTTFYKYLITLNGGRLSAIIPTEWSNLKTEKFKPIVKKEHISTGIADLDEILGGGFKLGSFNIFEFEEGVTKEEYRTIVHPLTLNAAYNNMGWLVILPAGSTPEVVRENLSRYADLEFVDSHYRFIEYLVSSTDKKYIVPMGGPSREVTIKALQNAIYEMRAIGNHVGFFMGMDTIENLRGNIAVQEIYNILTDIFKNKDVGFGIIKAGSKMNKELANMADVHLKIISINNVPCIYGIKPKTVLYALQFDKEKGLPYFNLVPIV